MNIFKEAKISKLKGTGYKVNRFITLWRNKTCAWNHAYIRYGIRWSDIWQLCPIWNTSHLCKRGVQFGIWLIYFEIGIYLKESRNIYPPFFKLKCLIG